MKPRRKTKSVKELNPKLYNFELRTYYNPIELIQALGNVHRYAYVYHDRDVTPEGELKTPHYHILVTFVNPRFYSGVDKTLTSFFSTKDENTNYSLFPLGTNASNSVSKRFRYLRHADDEDKYQYELIDISSNDKSWYIQQEEETPGSGNTSTDVNRAFLCDLLTLSDVQLVLRYGRDFIKNYSSYRQFRGVLLNEYLTTRDAYNAVLEANPDDVSVDGLTQDCLDPNLGLGDVSEDGKYCPTAYYNLK